MALEPVKRLSDVVFEPVAKAYRLGGFELAFLASGAFFMLPSREATEGSAG